MKYSTAIHLRILISHSAKRLISPLFAISLRLPHSHFLLSVDLPTLEATSSNPQIPPPTSPSPLTSHGHLHLNHPLRLHPPSYYRAHPFAQATKKSAKSSAFCARKLFELLHNHPRQRARVEGMKVFKPGDEGTYAFSLRNSLRSRLAKLSRLRRKMAFLLCERTFCK